MHVVDGSKARGYLSIRKLIENRGQVEIKLSNGHVRRARCYSLSDVRVKRLLKKWKTTGVFPSPYRQGIISDQINTLAALGVNIAWPLYKVMAGLKALMSDRVMKSGKTAWEEFVNTRRRGKKVENRKDEVGRVWLNFRALRKLPRRDKWNHPVGYKLRQMGSCIDLFWERGGQKYVRLNTHSINPISQEIANETCIPPVDTSKKTKGPI
jgi:hypothetical protein